MKNKLISLLIALGLFFVISSSNNFIAEASGYNSNDEVIQVNATKAWRTVTRKYNTIGSIPNSIVYNAGGLYGQLKLQSYSYERDSSTGKTYYLVIYGGYVSSSQGPISKIIQE